MSYFSISKCLPILFMPLGASLLLLAAALRWRRSFLILVPVAILLFFGVPATSDLVMRSLEDRYPHHSAADYPESDAIFVFGGMLGPRDHPNGTPEWNDSADRFEYALAVYKEKKVPLLVFSGGPERYEGGPDEGEILRGEALARGISENAIFVTHETWNTESEANILCQLAAERKWKQVLLVTSAYHMPRAMLLSAKCPAKRIPVPAAYQTPAPNTSWAFRRPEYYLPQAQALATSERALHEYWGMFFYTLAR